MIKHKEKTHNNKSDLVKNRLFGLNISNNTLEKILDYIVNHLNTAFPPYYSVTPNPEIITFSARHKELQAILNNAKIALCDGIGVVIAGWILGKPFKERFTGVDFMERLCKRIADRPITVGFLGGRDNVAEKASECLRHKWPQLKVAYVSQEGEEEGFIFTERFTQIEKRIYTDTIRENLSKNPRKSLRHIDVLFVAFGFPKQEEWMSAHVGKIPVRVLVGVGGAFDQIVSPSLRPPQAVQQIGLGWLYRLIRQPWRWRRQLALLEFMWMVLKKRINTHALRS